MLRFFGRGSAFCPDNNSAYFTDGNDLILIDLPMSSFHKLIHADPQSLYDPDIERIEKIYVLVTHTHSDHIGGIPMLAHYAFYVRGGLPVYVVAPSREIADDLEFFLNRLEGCDKKAYTIITADSLPGLIKDVIPTTHTDNLQGRCFGYHLSVNGQSVIYTGDTNTLKPFIPCIDGDAVLYTECASIRSGVHLYLPDIMEDLVHLSESGTQVFLMHLDDESAIGKMIAGTKIKPAPLYNEKEDDHIMNSEKILSDIFEVSQKLYKNMTDTTNTDHAKVFSYLTDLGMILTESDRASFWKWDKPSHTLWTMAATGSERITIPETTGLVGKALSEGKVIVTNDPYNDPNFNPDVDKKTGYVTKSILTMPVANIYGEYIGAYQVINKLGKDGKYQEDEDCRRLSLAAMICGLALESDVFLEESHTDKLTGLRNRMGFFHDFDRKYLPIIKDPSRKLSLFICDIDKFKKVNDTYGHNAGDEVLAQVASILHENVMEGGNVYRWGGEEFIMMMPDADLAAGAGIAEKIRLLIEANDCITQDKTVIHHTMSFGVTEFDPDKRIEDNVSAADEKLYTAKESGRNRVIS